MNPPLPQEFLVSLADVTGFDRVAFEQVHADGGQVTAVRLNPAKMTGDPRLPVRAACKQDGAGDVEEAGVTAILVPGRARIPWSSYGYYLPERPSFTFDPLFHAGAYYVQEPSSMFLEQALRQTVDLSRPLRVLDLCGAPGGKSTLIQSLLSKDSLLVSNEVIRTRVNVLQENMVKWGAANTVITSSDPHDFQRLANYFDVIVVDAPCSGSGLWRREPEAINEWSRDNVQLCHQRQQRILADCWPALRQDGILIYSTCSYSREEDEDILDWMMEDLNASGRRLDIDKSWNIVETVGKKGGYGYRFYPDKLKGEGFFISCVQKNDGGNYTYPRSKKHGVEKLTKSEEERLQPWVLPGLPLFYFRHQELIYALPANLQEDLACLQAACYLKKAGVLMGQLAVKEFIPEHDLALSSLISRELPVITLSKEQAIQYLRKEEIRIEEIGADDVGTNEAHGGEADAAGTGEGRTGGVGMVRAEMDKGGTDNGGAGRTASEKMGSDKSGMGKTGQGVRRGWALVRYGGLNLGWVKVLPNRINNYYPKEWRILKRG